MRTTRSVTSATGLTMVSHLPATVQITASHTLATALTTRRVTSDLSVNSNGRAPRDVGPGHSLSRYLMTRRAFAVLTVTGKASPVTRAVALIDVQAPPPMLYSPP